MPKLLSRGFPLVFSWVSLGCVDMDVCSHLLWLNYLSLSRSGVLNRFCFLCLSKWLWRYCSSSWRTCFCVFCEYLLFAFLLFSFTQILRKKSCSALHSFWAVAVWTKKVFFKGFSCCVPFSRITDWAVQWAHYAEYKSYKGQTSGATGKWMTGETICRLLHLGNETGCRNFFLD